MMLRNKLALYYEPSGKKKINAVPGKGWKDELLGGR
jgi:hypothetical protein